MIDDNDLDAYNEMIIKLSRPVFLPGLVFYWFLNISQVYQIFGIQNQTKLKIFS